MYFFLNQNNSSCTSNEMCCFLFNFNKKKLENYFRKKNNNYFITKNKLFTLMLQKEFKSRRKVKDFAAFSLKYKLTRKEKYRNLL